MPSWYELKFIFDDQDEPVPVKQRLIRFLNDHSVQNIVESYYDGLAPGSIPEEVESDIFGDADSLPLVVYFENKQAALKLVALVSANFPNEVSSMVRKLDAADSANAWTDETVFTTELFIISPHNIDEVDRNGKQLICIEPGRSFGNGQHVTTLAMLRAIEQFNPGSATHVLDVGTGCGVLLIAVAKLGVRHLVGTDLSADILREAAQNLKNNRVASFLIETSDIPHDRGSFNLILANIPVAGLRPLLPAMLQVASPDATFIFSGFTAADGKTFQSELSAFGLTSLRTIEERGWVALSLRRT